MINWVYFPKSSPPPEFGLFVVALFEEIHSEQSLNGKRSGAAK